MLPLTPKKQIHINRNTLASNLKHGRRDPVVRLQQGTRVSYGHEVDLLGPDGAVLASVVYQPDEPLSCGARVWVETTLDCAVRVWQPEVKEAA